MIKALELACMLEKSCGGEQHILDLYKDRVHIAAELRRLRDLNAQLVAALEEIAAEEWRGDGDPFLDRSRVRSKARAELAKAKEQA